MAQVIIVGAGLAGMGAAYSLKKAGVDAKVLEALPEAGGRVRSLQWHGAWIDAGAEFITDRDLVYFQDAITTLGLGKDLLTYPGSEITFDVWKDNRAHPLKITEPASFFSFGAISRKGKFQLLRMLPLMLQQMRANGNTDYEPWRAAWCDDESVETWLKRIAPEFLEYVVEPTFELYCGYQPHDYGRAMFAYLMTQYRQTIVTTFREGLGQLTRALAKHLNVVTGADVERVQLTSENGQANTVTYRYNGNLQHEQADFVIMAVPGSKVLGLVEGLGSEQRAFFEQVRYTPHELPFLKLSQRPDGLPNRLYFPRLEDQDIAGVGYEPASTTPDVEFFRVSMKNAFNRRMMDKPDAENTAAIIDAACRRYPQIRDLIVDSYVSRWKEALPLFPAGYLRALDKFRQLPAQHNVAFAGDYLAGPSTGAAYVTGQRAAEEILARLH